MPDPETPLCRVAICDDVEAFRDLLAAVIGRTEGLKVVGEAANGVQAIEMVRSNQPDVLLLDLSMPVMDGMEALPLILAAAPDTKVIILSGFGSDRLREQAMAAGAAGYIEKGERPAVVIKTVQRIGAASAQTG